MGWDEPLSTFYEDSRTQLIYLASELSGARRITGLALNFLTLPGLPLQQWTIRLKHTSGASYTAASIWDNSGWTVVYQNHERINQRGWVSFSQFLSTLTAFAISLSTLASIIQITIFPGANVHRRKLRWPALFGELRIVCMEIRCRGVASRVTPSRGKWC